MCVAALFLIQAISHNNPYIHLDSNTMDGESFQSSDVEPQDGESFQSSDVEPQQPAVKRSRVSPPQPSSAPCPSALSSQQLLDAAERVRAHSNTPQASCSKAEKTLLGHQITVEEIQIITTKQCRHCHRDCFGQFRDCPHLIVNWRKTYRSLATDGERDLVMSMLLAKQQKAGFQFRQRHYA